MADPKRGFSPSGVPEKLDDYHGGCRAYRIISDIADKSTQSISVEMTFAQAMRLMTAIQSGVLKLNRYNRSSRAGRQMGLRLIVKPDAKALSVIETKLRPFKDRRNSEPINTGNA